ncbi:hypothetical protein B0H16DRAFT_1465514 [Mycena metata]|uniref:Uncharacterized protein n=1 Tax=Mycena metata TaxID=1033252 RepID=A0AAD7IC63_9AGAR|nr:hypothetical protein B0H16DRAFT_1465514 [Mycena metata]
MPAVRQRFYTLELKLPLKIRFESALSVRGSVQALEDANAEPEPGVRFEHRPNLEPERRVQFVPVTWLNFLRAVEGVEDKSSRFAIKIIRLAGGANTTKQTFDRATCQSPVLQCMLFAKGRHTTAGSVLVVIGDFYLGEENFSRTAAISCWSGLRPQVPLGLSR